MNELTGHPGLTGVGQGKITSKPDGKPSTSENDNEKILERTAHSAVLSVSRGKLHAQANRTGKGASDKLLVDDVSLGKKTAGIDDKTTAETLASNKDERSKQEQSSGGDSESFSEAQSTEALKAKSNKDEENLKQLITALKSLKKSDCRRILESPNQDPSHAFANLWDNDSTKRLTEASTLLEGFEARLQSKIEALDSYEKFEAFVLGEHKSTDDQVLAATLYRVSENFALRQEKKVAGFDSTNQKVQELGVKNLFEFLQSEDHRRAGVQSRLIRDVNLAYLKELIVDNQNSEKLHYRLEATFRFSRIKKSNPLEKLRQKVIERFSDDESVKKKAKSLKETTEKNWTTLLDKIVHSVTEFSQILFSGLFSLLGEVNEKLGADLAKKPVPVYVKPGIALKTK